MMMIYRFCINILHGTLFKNGFEHAGMPLIWCGWNLHAYQYYQPSHKKTTLNIYHQSVIKEEESIETKYVF